MTAIPCTYGRCRAPSTCWVSATGPDGHHGSAVCGGHADAAAARARRLTGGAAETGPLVADAMPTGSAAGSADSPGQLEFDVEGAA